jgi:succinylarginine dihydrolase
VNTVEVNFDGLPGPTHNFAGLAHGNLASAGSAGIRSFPRQAALQSIGKMRSMLELGLTQGILPPQPRPAFHFLSSMGFTGPTDAIIQQLAEESPALLAAVYSSSSMWVANAATVTPAPDSADGRIHFTTANLSSQLHRSLEAEDTRRLLETIFPDSDAFAQHAPLPCILSDEGAANHTRLCGRYEDKGVSLFVYGRRLISPEPQQPKLPARQTLEASQSVARSHGLAPSNTVYARQLPAAVDAGVFHNDVICVGNRNLLFVHEQAFENQQQILDRLDATCEGTLEAIIVPAGIISLERAVSSYLFNGQLITPNEDRTAQILVAPLECRDDLVVAGYLDQLVSQSALSAVRFLDVRQSMRNGGGPACLRLRVVMSDGAISRVGARVIADDSLLDTLETWIETHYPEHIDPRDLLDPELVAGAQTALQGIYRILNLDNLMD